MLVSTPEVACSPRFRLVKVTFGMSPTCQKHENIDILMDFDVHFSILAGLAPNHFKSFHSEPNVRKLKSNTGGHWWPSWPSKIN